LSFGVLSLRCHFLAARCPGEFAHGAHEIREKETPIPETTRVVPLANIGSPLKCAGRPKRDFLESWTRFVEQSGIALGLATAVQKKTGVS
jgi:hypothetical protein